jgi:ribulose-phosphate 3-epimerase
MIVIPSLNFESGSSEKEIEDIFGKLEILRINRNVKNLHIDISDGSFTPVLTPFDPKFFFDALGNKFDFFVHLMVYDLKKEVLRWLNFSNVRKIIFHLRSDFKRGWIADLIHSREDVNFELALELEENIYDFLEMINFYKCTSVEFLSVKAGFSGQEFNPSVLEKIKIFKEFYKHKDIFVDGGINNQNILKIKELGVRGVVSSSYLFKSPSVLKAYDELNI